MNSAGALRPSWRGLAACVLAWVAVGCQPAHYRRQGDRAADGIIRQYQLRALGRSEPFTIQTPAQTLRRRLFQGQELPYSGQASLGPEGLKRIEHWPKNEPIALLRPADEPVPPWTGQGTLKLTLTDALQVAARNSREYQSQKEEVFQAALDLDLESDAFRHTFLGAVEGVVSSDLSGSHPSNAAAGSAAANWSRRFKSGAALTAGLAVDLVKLLTLDRASSFGVFADATVTVPLLRGAGRHIVSEPLTQAQREVVYAILTFERFKRALAVQVASGYLEVLQQLDQVQNAEENYRGLIASGRRARRLADAGRLPEIQVDQARQDELRARDRWVAAQQAYARRLDGFKITLGLPADAGVELDREELNRLSALAKKVLAGEAATRPAAAGDAAPEAPQADAPIRLEPPARTGGGPLEMDPAAATLMALKQRLDLRVAHGRVYDAQRGVVVAADALRADLTLGGTAQAGGRRGVGAAAQDNASPRPERGAYSLGLLLDLPIERTAERNAYRNSFILLAQAVRNVQELEDQVKLAVRNALRGLLHARESFRIQAQSVQLARRRVASTELFLEAGRAQIRDVLEAKEALVSAQNALTAALVNYRVTELELQRDAGLLNVNEKGLWREYKPEANAE